MPILHPDERLLVATHNPGKAREIRDLLGPYVGSVITSGELGLAEPEETGRTFEENAVLKARSASAESGMVALADDSGLSVSALNGDPGIYSARWAGPEKDFTRAMEKIHRLLGDCEDRSASFICVLALAWPDGPVRTFEGRVNGTIVWPPCGEKGFGYDPVFVPDGYSRTFAEMEPADKHRISHRAKAFEKLLAVLSAPAS
ncbi:MAG: RdgB/HAM1 family non-canonical purine NTP pyrophosphatase [Rhodospirillales bacterium]|nr:RdgB/HAM1 family non-canonical purine NTP pyrophosphatase [Alphaproteobacteria bacterium]MCB1839008.1 RdgB/HAM1 family non-canonical purine NTP pyrophosphatase [Alphaproteobacteria bacterium]MCB9976453.1 RdgB/HAM1 family non-canonical purine NTP pyrophosphatase [Rhodospirillales bacterium]